MAEGRISSHGGGNEYWLNPDHAAATYKALGRTDDAIGVLRADFIQQPSVQNYRVLLDFAAGVDREDAEHAWALARAK